MEYRDLGSTGIKVSVAGLGTGGASRLGLTAGRGIQNASSLVRYAYDQGVNLFDTSPDYGTEHILGEALRGVRNDVVISTKVSPRRLSDSTRLTRRDIRTQLQDSLRALGTEAIDIYYLHRVLPRDYTYSREELLPELERARAEGEIRFIGVSENSGVDPDHEMLSQAVDDDCWDVMMVAFNFFNQSARTRILSGAREHGIGIQVMVAARSHFSQPDQLSDEIRRLVAAGEISSDAITAQNPLAFLDPAGGPSHLTDVCYLFAAAEPGVDSVLVGTGNMDHLRQSLDALGSHSLPIQTRDTLIATFGHLSQDVLVPGRTYNA